MPANDSTESLTNLTTNNSDATTPSPTAEGRPSTRPDTAIVTATTSAAAAVMESTPTIAGPAIAAPCECPPPTVSTPTVSTTEPKPATEPTPTPTIEPTPAPTTAEPAATDSGNPGYVCYFPRDGIGGPRCQPAKADILDYFAKKAKKPRRGR